MNFNFSGKKMNFNVLGNPVGLLHNIRLPGKMLSSVIRLNDVYLALKLRSFLSRNVEVTPLRAFLSRFHSSRPFLLKLC